MFDSVRKSMQPGTAWGVDIAPLIDVVFILLLFFLLTTTFVRETGLTVDKAQAVRARPLEAESLRVSIGASGAVYTQGEEVDLATLRQRVRSFVTERPKASVVVIPDKEVAAGRLVEVMDAAKRGGAEDLAVAASEARR